MVSWKKILIITGNIPNDNNDDNNNSNNNNNNNNNNDSNSESIKNYNWTFILSHGYVDSVGSRPTITAKYVRNNHKSSII